MSFYETPKFSMKNVDISPQVQQYSTFTALAIHKIQLDIPTILSQYLKEISTEFK